jgi:serralysin
MWHGVLRSLAWPNADDELARDVDRVLHTAGSNATPTANAVPITTFDTSGLSNLVASLLIGSKWGIGFGEGVTLTYSFPMGTAYFATGYGKDEWSTWSQLGSDQTAAVTDALHVWAASANVTFNEASDNSSEVGELRFAISSVVDQQDNAYAWGYFPGSDPQAGDIWFSQSWNSNATVSAAPGTYEYETILHEIGHALGLKHPFEGDETLSSQYDNMFYTVMSYSVKADTLVSDVGADFHPTTPMYLDLLAMQDMYGQSLVANPGKTKYVFDGAQHYWQTINDTSGRDTIQYNSVSGGIIDLSNENFSQLGLAIHFTDGTSSTNTVAIGPNTVIENAIGGSGGDTLIGNALANSLLGRGGDDTIDGNGGNDVINGGLGNDFIDGGEGSDTVKFTQRGDLRLDLVMETVQDTGDGLDTFISIERAFGWKGNDRFWGTGADNVLSGMGGRDVLAGRGGRDTLDGGSGADVLRGGKGSDKLIGGTGADKLVGGTGKDLFVCTKVGESTGTHYDTISNCNFLAADRFNLGPAVTGIDKTIGAGTLRLTHFDADLGRAANAAHLNAHHAVLFKPNAGGLRDNVFLVVDANGVGGYQAGKDYVFLLDHATHLSSLNVADFI